MHTSTRYRLLALAALLGCAAIAYTQTQQPSKLDVVKLADNMYVIHNDFVPGNTTVLVTNEGVLLVDDKYPVDADNIVAEVKKLTSQPIKYVINTHHHGDHSGGNPTMQKLGAIAVSSEQARKNMVAGKQPGLTNITIEREGHLYLGGEQVDLYYFGRAHTNGDAMVFFPAARVLHMADVFPTKGLPGMDANNGGSGVEYAQTLTRAADFADKNNVAKIVNGHNEATTTRAELREYISYVKEFVQTVQDGKRAGKTVDQVAAAWKTPAKYPGYEATPIPVRVKGDVELIFKETK